MPRRLILAACLVLASPPAMAEDLDATSIRERLIGFAFRWQAETPDLGGFVEFDPDGRARMTIAGVAAEEAGSWRLDGNRLCTRWMAARAGSEKCYFVAPAGRDRFTTSGGNIFWRADPEA